MCSDDILTLAAAIRVGAYFNFWCAKCFVTNLKESSDLKIPSISDEVNKSITNQSKDSPYRPNYCKFYQVKSSNSSLSTFRTSLSVFEVFWVQSHLSYLQSWAFKGSLVHKVTKKVLGKLRNIKKTLLRLRTRWLVIEEIYKAVFRVLGFYQEVRE